MSTLTHLSRASLLLSFALATSALHAADVVTTLLPPTGNVPAGAWAQLDMVSLNPGAVEVPFLAPSTLNAQLETATGSWPVILTGATAAPLAVGPGGFASRRYGFAVPTGANGRALLKVTGLGSELGAVTFELGTSTDAETVPALIESQLGKLAANATVSSTLARSFAGRFLPNQPVYFLYGSGSDQAAKFQFSFDYRLGSLRWGKSRQRTQSTLRLGYTQRSLWDIDARSSPFYDSSYMPEVAVVTDWPLPVSNASWFTWMGLRTGYQHESNGRDGDESRSLNRVYFRPRFIIGALDSWFLVVLPEVYAYVGGVENNPKIADYRGYAKLQAYVGRNDGPTLRFNGWMGKDFNHFTYQLDLTYPVQLGWLDLESFLHLQYFDGYGESLRAYDQKSDALRIGISFVR